MNAYMSPKPLNPRLGFYGAKVPRAGQRERCDLVRRPWLRKAAAAMGTFWAFGPERLSQTKKYRDRIPSSLEQRVEHGFTKSVIPQNMAGLWAAFS